MKRQEIKLALHTGERDAVYDADHIHTDDSLDEVHFIHEAEDGCVNVNYSYDDATECVPFGDSTEHRHFDITGKEYRDD